MRTHLYRNGHTTYCGRKDNHELPIVWDKRKANCKTCLRVESLNANS